LLLPALSLVGALLLFGGFVALGGHNPIEAWRLLLVGAFGDSFSIQNSLQRAAPLMLTALCVAIPARAGLTIIGGEGALVIGALACAGLPYGVTLPADWVGSAWLLIAAATGGGLWMALAGALRQFRGVNETISSLLLAYVAPDFRFRGVTSALLDEMERHAHAQHADRMSLTTTDTARAFFLARGYTPEEEIGDLFSDDQSTLLKEWPKG
jgi:ABC-type uncharacterized transport system permease subunit